MSKSRKIGCCGRWWCQRKSWDKFSADLTKQQFCQYFCMSRECFDLLCTKIKINIGEVAFKSEEYLCESLSTLRPPNSVAEAQMRNKFEAHSVHLVGSFAVKSN